MGFEAGRESLMAEWLEQVSQGHEMYCHNLEVMSLNPSRDECGVCRTSVLSRTWTKNTFKTVTIEAIIEIKHRRGELLVLNQTTIKMQKLPAWKTHIKSQEHTCISLCVLLRTYTFCACLHKAFCDSANTAFITVIMFLCPVPLQTCNFYAFMLLCFYARFWNFFMSNTSFL